MMRPAIAGEEKSVSKYKLTKCENVIHSVVLFLSILAFALFLVPEAPFWLRFVYMLEFTIIVGLALKVLIIWFRR